MRIEKIYAPPYFWSEETAMKKNECGSSYTVKVEVVSESQLKGRFLFRIHLPI